jgi:uncharacterized protein (DUF433 family)
MSEQKRGAKRRNGLATADTSDGSPIVASRPGVCGGDLCVAGTRLPLWVLYKAWKAGKSNAQLRKMYPVLKSAPLQDLREFAESHSDEMERQFAANERP